LLQLLQRAKDLLQLQSALLKLDKYELLIVDDIMSKNRNGNLSLFELIAHRYEIKSLLLTSIIL